MAGRQLGSGRKGDGRLFLSPEAPHGTPRRPRSRDPGPAAQILRRADRRDPNSLSPPAAQAFWPSGLMGRSAGISVRDAGELLAGALQLAGPLAGPAESAGGLATHVGGRSTAGEVDVLAPVHPPRVGAAGVAGEVA